MGFIFSLISTLLCAMCCGIYIAQHEWFTASIYLGSTILWMVSTIKLAENYK